MSALNRLRRFACLAAFLPLPLWAAGEPVTLDFKEAEIDVVIHAIGQISGRNFLVDPRVKGRIDLVTHSPVPPETSYGLLLSALRLQGFAAVEEDGVTKIVPEADAKTHAVPVVDGAHGAPRGDRIVTRVFALRKESAAQLATVLRPMVSANNTVVAFPSNNTVVVTDYAENVARIASVIESLDVGHGGMHVIELHHAVAVDLAPLLLRLLAEQPGAGNGVTPPQIVAEPRINALLVRADTPELLADVQRLVATLDRPGAGGNLHVVYLRNADATQVAETLNAALSDDGFTTQRSVQPGLTRTGGDETVQSDGLAGMRTGSSSGLGAGSRAGMVQADAVNNALVITAPEAVYRRLRGVIDQLDRRRAQVYIEALIAEISTERAAEFGLQWFGGAAAGSVGVVGGTGFGSGSGNLFNVISANAAGQGVVPPNGLNIAIGGGTVNVPGIGEILSLGVLARFLENEVRANILSTPNIITLDNEEAKIVVGRNLPFVTGQYTNTGGGTTPVNPFQTIERRDVGLTLQVKPQISEGGAIRLEIYQEASAVVDSADTSGNGPVTTKRSIESMVLVDDGAIIALGGLVEDSYSMGEEKVPLLGDIPVAGNLFRYQARKRAKTNLVVFLRPVILRDRESYRQLTQSRYDYVIGEQGDIARPGDLMRGEDPPPQLAPVETAVFLSAAEALGVQAGGTPGAVLR